MDFLLDPNVAYLIILGGALLGLLAIVAPGTGMLEVGTLFCLALAGYAVYHLTINAWALVVMLMSIIPFVYASQKPKRELYLGLSILLLVIGSVFVFPRLEKQSGVNPFIAIISSGFVAGFLWLAVRKSLEVARVRPMHDLSGLIGQFGEAKTNIGEEGSVQVAGELWTARSENSIPAGSSIRVMSRDGFVLVVEKSVTSQS